MMDISFPDNQLSLYLEVRCRLGRAVTSPSTEPCMLQYRQTRKDVTTRATVACLLLGKTNCFLTRFEACPTGRRSCLVKNPWPGKSQGPEANLLLLFCQMITMSNSPLNMYVYTMCDITDSSHGYPCKTIPVKTLVWMRKVLTRPPNHS